MEFKLDLGSLRFESGYNKICNACDEYNMNQDHTMLAFDVPDTNNTYCTTTERVCTKCMWATFKTVIKLLNSGKKLI